MSDHYDEPHECEALSCAAWDLLADALTREIESVLRFRASAEIVSVRREP